MSQCKFGSATIVCTQLLLCALSNQDYLFWLILGRAADTAEIGAQLGVWFNGECLEVDAAMQHDGSVINMLWAMWLDSMGIKEYTDTRFAGQVPILCDLMTLEALGLPAVCDIIYKNPDVHKYFLNGYKLLDEQGRTVNSCGLS